MWEHGEERGDGEGKRILIDQAIPTDKVLEHRWPDLTIRLAEERRVVIFEV